MLILHESTFPGFPGWPTIGPVIFSGAVAVIELLPGCGSFESA